MTANDIGIELSVNVGSAGYTIPAGAVCAIVLAPGQVVDQFLAYASYPANVSGTVVSYTTQASTDLPNGGWWTIWATVTASGIAFTTPPGQFYVNYAPVFQGS